MIQQKLLDKLNQQINLEAFSSNLYLSMSSWCSANGFKGAGKFLYEHSKEELQHMRKLFNYVNDTGSMAKVGATDEPKSDFTDIRDVFEQTLKHEQMITKEINSLVELSLKEKDYSTFNFLQWYVSEQHEEEALFMEILEKIDMIGVDKGRGLFMIDNEISKLGQMNHSSK